MGCDALDWQLEVDYQGTQSQNDHQVVIWLLYVLPFLDGSDGGEK
jgi:hypothetical protein